MEPADYNGRHLVYLGNYRPMDDPLMSASKAWNLAGLKCALMVTASERMRPLVAFAQSAAHVLAIRVTDRVGKGIRGAPRDALIADSVDPALRGRAFGFHRAADHLGAVVGPLVAYVLQAVAVTEHLAAPDVDVDGVCVSSFTLGSDTAVGVMQHFRMSPRWLDHIPMGGASGVVAMRRAARAVQCGDASIVACIAGDTNHPESFKNTVSGFSRFSQDAVYPYGAGGPNASFALLTDYYMRHYGATREDFGKLCVAQRDNALRNPHALMKKPYLALPISMHPLLILLPSAALLGLAVSLTAGSFKKYL